MSKEIIKKNSGIQKSSKKKLDLTAINLEAFSSSLGIFSIPRLFYQLVIFVLDGSGSMTYPGMSGSSKGEEVESAIKKVIDRLHKSKNKSSFDINIWAYANESVEMLQITQVEKINNYSSLNPTDFIKEYDKTRLEDTLKNVEINVNKYLEVNKNKNSQALIIILSDGAIHDQKESELICENIKMNKNITISTVLFESKLWKEKYQDDDLTFLKENMKTLANNSTLFTSTLDPEEIRKHMIKSISTVSKID
jgi:uncharacterized protein YegL